jgi:hypothetical protein
LMWFPPFFPVLATHQRNQDLGQVVLPDGHDECT